MTTALTPAAPTAGVIASLSVRPWVDQTLDGRSFAPLLLTHPPARRDDDTPAAIEARMRGIALALRADLPDDRMTSTGARVAVHRGVVLVRFDGTPYVLTVHAPRWGRIAAGIGAVLLAVGFDPLPAGACGAEIDQYIERAGVTRRIRFASADVVLGRPQWRDVELLPVVGTL